MLVLSRNPTAAALPDRFRGTVQRWTIDSGPLAGTHFDVSFNTDWSVDWRIVAGERQGRAGRAREFAQQPVRAQLFIVFFAMSDGETVAATVDFASKRLAGFLLRGERATPIAGTLHLL